MSNPSAPLAPPLAKPPARDAAPVAVPHTLSEDAVAIFTGVLLISVGVAFFTSAGLLTGGTAGLAFLLHYALYFILPSRNAFFGLILSILIVSVSFSTTIIGVVF